ncbi:MAG: formate dehydrogenase accessory sulfurtransferase FdhD [Methanomassiliicoccales archaeon]
MGGDIIENRQVITYRNGNKECRQDAVVKESPVTIILNEQEIGTLICSPYAQEELVVGFLVSEGLLTSVSDIREIFCRDEQGVVWVETTQEIPAVDTLLRRNFASCCGRGRPSLYFINDYRQIKPVESSAQFTVNQLLKVMSLIDAESEIFRRTGGVHGAALVKDQGIVVYYEDIGRHNALDRILGYTFLHEVETSAMAVALTGRIASEMLTKSARIGVPLVISRAAPTGLAIDLAEQLGLTVIGFAREQSLNIYCHGERIIDD